MEAWQDIKDRFPAVRPIFTGQGPVDRVEDGVRDFLCEGPQDMGARALAHLLSAFGPQAIDRSRAIGTASRSLAEEIMDRMLPDLGWPAGRPVSLPAQAPFRLLGTSVPAAGA